MCIKKVVLLVVSSLLILVPFYGTAQFIVRASAANVLPSSKSTVEGCVSGVFKFSTPSPIIANTTIKYLINGTAANGIDYTQVSDSVIILAGDSTASVEIIPIADAIKEGDETVIIALIDPFTGLAYSSDTLKIIDKSSLNVSIDDSTLCAGQSAQLTATGGYNYSWSPTTGLSNSTISNPIANPTSNAIYTCNSSIGTCSFTKTVNVKVSSAINISATVQVVKCFGENSGSINTLISGGNAPYNFAWSNGASSQNITGIVAGNYTFTVEDKNNCTANTSQIVTQPVLLQASSIVASVNCYGGTSGNVSVKVLGGTTPFKFAWSGISSTISTIQNVPSGNYSVAIEDANNCSTLLNISVQQPLPFSISYSQINNYCNGKFAGAIDLAVSGGNTGYKYNWSNAAQLEDLNSLAAGDYQVTVTDAKNCVTISPIITISEPAALVITPLKITDIKCFNQNTGAIKLNITGGTRSYNYIWNDGATNQNRDSLLAGNYSLTVADKNACSATFTTPISQPSELLATAIKTDISCFGKTDGVLKLQVSGGVINYNFKWNNGSISKNISSLNAGNYQATVTDANGCNKRISSTIIQPVALALSIAKTDATCNNFSNGKAIANVSGGTASYIYNWSNNFTAYNNLNLAAGNYSITVLDTHGCSVSSNTIISQPSQIVVHEKVISPICFGLQTASITTAVLGGKMPYTFNWNNGSKTQNEIGVGAGMYTITVSDANFCTVAKSISIVQPDSINLNATVKALTCDGSSNGKINVQATGGNPSYNFRWSNGQTASSIINLSEGYYTLTATDKNSCKTITTFHLDSIRPIIADAVIKNILCTPLANGEIDLTIVEGTPPYQYLWSNDKKTEDLLNLRVGSYKVTVKDASSCLLTKTFTLKNDSAFHIHASPEVKVAFGESTELNVTHNAPGLVIFDWQSATESSLSCTSCQAPNATPNTTTLYTVNAVDDRGCVAKDTISVMVIVDHKLWVPNAFTPNGDGSNDLFQVFGNLKSIKNFGIKIFNRWGEMVFESDAPEFTWDGNFKGALLQPGGYIYALETAFADGGEATHLKGTVTILR